MKTRSSYSKEEPKNKKGRHIPDVLYTESGATFYPCKHCCRAFACKKDMEKHSEHCSLPLVDQAIQVKDDRDLQNDDDDEPNNNALNIKQEQEKTSLAYIDVVPESISTFDLKTKAKIVKQLNQILKGTPVQVTVIENGDIVIRFSGTAQTPHLEALVRKTESGCVEISMKRLCGDEDVPTIAEVIEKLFGKDDQLDVERLMSLKMENIAPVSLQSVTDGEVVVEDDEEMKDINGAIVLEDLDIHICKQCGAVYQTLEDLVNHDKYEHRNFKKRFAPAELAKYTEIFKASKDNVCPICLKQLKHKWCWSRHYQSHSEVPEFQCNVCKKKFTRDDHRKNHERRHVLPEKMP